MTSQCSQNLIRLAEMLCGKALVDPGVGLQCPQACPAAPIVLGQSARQEDA